MRKIKSMMAVLGLLMILLPTAVYASEEVRIDTGCEAEPAAAAKKGLVKEKGKYYYYVNGKKVLNAWKKINGEKYYFYTDGHAVTNCANINGKAYVFNTKGHLLHPAKKGFYKAGQNTYYVDINGQASTGWFIVKGKLYYADPKGRAYKNRTRDGIVFSSTGAAKSSNVTKLKIQVIQIMDSITTPKMSKEQKLRAAWNYVVYGGNFNYRVTDINIWRDGWVKDSAYQMFSQKRGSCTEFACAFAALAAEAGYTPYVVYGRVPGSRDGAPDGMTRHCWVEINGLYYDPEGTWAGWSGYVYGAGSYPMYHTVTQYSNYIKSNPK